MDRISSLSSSKHWNCLQHLHSINVGISVQPLQIFLSAWVQMVVLLPAVAFIFTVTRKCSGFKLLFIIFRLSNITIVLIVDNRNVRFWIWVIVITVRKVRRYANVFRGINRVCVLQRNWKTIRYVIDFVTWI